MAAKRRKKPNATEPQPNKGLNRKQRLDRERIPIGFPLRFLRFDFHSPSALIREIRGQKSSRNCAILWFLRYKDEKMRLPIYAVSAFSVAKSLYLCAFSRPTLFCKMQ